MTCNPNWPEIQSQLREGQTFADIPMVVARVFAQRLSLLISKLPEVFPGAGARQYLIRVVEFQKRGLPHAHILVKFTADCATAHDIDSAVSAELPVDPVDRALVEEFMLHSHGAYCRRERHGHVVCRFGYEKAHTPETIVDDEGRVQYRRRGPGDGMVVPHNIQLLRMFQCHINVEVASAAQIYQYMFKYIHKGDVCLPVNRITRVLTRSPLGPDRAHFNIFGAENDHVDEIEEFWAGRYLSAMEAMWRILGKNITQKIPSVTPLPVHLEGANTFRQYVRRGGRESHLSLLDRYFLRPTGHFVNTNGHLQSFASLLYTDYYRLFRLARWEGQFINSAEGTFLEQEGPDGQQRMVVIQRQHARIHLTRLMTVKPSAGERFYLRTLLNHRPAVSFADLRTIDGTAYRTYQEAVTALGLFEDVQEAEQAMAEAVAALYVPRRLRFLFIDLLVNDCCHAPLRLWDTFKFQLSQDFFLQNGHNLHLAENEALQEISHWLAMRGHALEEYGLPVPRTYSREVLCELQRWNAHPEGLAARADAAERQLNLEQAAVFNEVMDAVRNDRPLCLFIDGKAGRGKTFLVNAICDAVRSTGRIVIPTATSAFAAQLYPGGRTTHSAFKVICHVIYLRRNPLTSCSDFRCQSTSIPKCSSRLLKRTTHVGSYYGRPRSSSGTKPQWPIEQYSDVWTKLSVE